MKDLNSFISEKAEASKKEKPLKKDEGKDDKKYIALMVDYKKMRRNPNDREKAKRILEKAMKLGREGDVSEKAKVAAAYL
ncbi:MAG: hypothetical protein EB165_06330 [Euryarchaeota archaeon]|nr:hypothetical protein [Euryarchaeota archaeon]